MNRKIVTIVLILSLLGNALQFYLNYNPVVVKIDSNDVLKQLTLDRMNRRAEEIAKKEAALDSLESDLNNRLNKILSDSLSNENLNTYRNEINSINNLDELAFYRKLIREYEDSDRLDRSGYYWVAR